MQKYHVVHTPGTFGNFLAWLIDCYHDNEIKKSPFLSTGNSHGREVNTISWDIVLPQYMEKYKRREVNGATIIGITYPEEYFPYLLHASLDRTNDGQYGESGVAYAEKDFYGFVTNHTAVLSDGKIWMKDYLSRLKEYFNFECTEKNPTVPRLVLRNLLWLNLASQRQHIWTATNKLIKNSDHAKISIETILDYAKLNSYLQDLFGYTLDFSDIHEQFINLNNSLKEHRITTEIVDAVKQSKNIPIPKLSVIGECIVIYNIEKYYFDLNFFNVPFYFTNTKEILEYVDYYPKYMKTPNKFYQANWRDFNKNE
jgi:glutaredoxin-related protein